MSNVRLIARLDIKGPNLIKGVRFEGLRVMGCPNEYALRYYEQGADELIYIDTVASLYERNSLKDIVERAAENVFIPMTVGGGIRSVDDASRLLRSGADKIAVNTAAIGNPGLITDISMRFGTQCVVLSIEAKQVGPSRWEAYTDGGRERTGLDAIDWARRGVDLGAGEVLLTSVDREGTRKGFDLDLIRAASRAVSVPIIASGGLGSPADLIDAVRSGADAIATADILHYRRATVGDLRHAAEDAGIPVRRHQHA